MSPIRTIIVFPGQGAVRPGPARLDQTATRRDLALAAVQEVADTVIGADSVDMTNPKSDCYPLWLYAHALTSFEGMRGSLGAFDVLVGHSFGEITALTLGGAFSAVTGAELICHRILALRAAAPRGAMLALDADVQKVEQLLDAAGEEQIAIAAENAERRTVVSGSAEAIETIQRIAGALGVRARRLNARYPYHCPQLMQEAAHDFVQRARYLSISSVQLPVYSPILRRYYERDDNLVQCIARHLVSRVRFSEALSVLSADGPTSAIECGCLTGLLSSPQTYTFPDISEQDPDSEDTLRRAS